MGIWREIEGFPNYLISESGRVWSKTSGIYMKQSPNTSGYASVSMSRDNRDFKKLVHMMVAETFISERLPGYQVNHIDGDKMNPARWNLEWVTASENVTHAYRSGLRGPTDGGVQLTSKPIRIIETGEVFPSINACARSFGGDMGTIVKTMRGHQRSHKGYTFELLLEEDAL